MRIHAINAFEGDCLLLENQGKYALIDGGPRGTFAKHLQPYLDDTVGSDGRLEAVIVSHVDADHISGVLDLLAEIEADIADEADKILGVGDLWHNSFARTIDIDGRIASDLQQMMSLAGRAQVMAANGSIALLGISQGARLRRLALKLKVPLNDHANGELMSVEDSVAEWALGNASFTVVGPTAANLEELKRKWVKWIEDNIDAFETGDPQAMANADKSVPNLSSIVLFGGTPHGDVLLTGDARGDHILQGLEQSGKIAPGGEHHFRLLKLQHHGSDRNIDRDFLERLTADIYLVSADGKHDNPDFETLKLLVDVAEAQGRESILVSTNGPQSIIDLKAERPPEQHGYRLVVRDSQKHAVVVDLAARTAG